LNFKELYCATNLGSHEVELRACPMSMAHIVWILKLAWPVAEFIDHNQLRHRVVIPARQPCSLACRCDNPMPELTLSPSQGSRNSAEELFSLSL
jgi:hypothetical protein